MRTESNIKPLVQHEIEALPKVVGRTCTVIFYENIEGPIEKEEGDQVYTYDRYTLETQYRENLEESIEKNREAWLQKAIKAEQEGEEKTEMEILQEQVASLQDENAALKASNEELSGIVDDLIVASLGGEENVYSSEKTVPCRKIERRRSGKCGDKGMDYRRPEGGDH